MFSLAHLHLVLNHLPIIITGLGLLLLGVGIARRSDTLARTALTFFVAAALVALPTYLTGEPAEHAVDGLPGVVDGLIEEHQDAALTASLTVGALGLFSLWVLWRHRGQALVSRAMLMVALGGAVLGSGLMVWTGLLGGQIRHTEIRAGSSPAGAAAGEATGERES